jgi:hypothetical protein
MRGRCVAGSGRGRCFPEIAMLGRNQFGLGRSALWITRTSADILPLVVWDLSCRYSAAF